MASTVLYLNDYDTSTLGLVVSGVTGINGAPDVEPSTVRVYGRAGSILIGASPALKARVITVTGTLIQSSQAALRTAWDTLKGLAMAECEVRFPQPSDRYWRATLTDASETPIGPQFLNNAIGVTLRFTASDPLAYDRYLTSSAFGSLAATAPLGTAPSAPLLILKGTNNPTVTVYDASGTVRGTLGLTVTLGSNDALMVDCHLMTITRSTAGTNSDALSTLSSGDFPLLDPAYGVVRLGVSGGTGLALYRKAWL